MENFKVLPIKQHPHRVNDVQTKRKKVTLFRIWGLLLAVISVLNNIVLQNIVRSYLTTSTTTNITSSEKITRQQQELQPQHLTQPSSAENTTTLTTASLQKKLHVSESALVKESNFGGDTLGSHSKKENASTGGRAGNGNNNNNNNNNSRNKAASNFGGGSVGSSTKKEKASTGGRGGGGNNNNSSSNNTPPAKTGTVTTTNDENGNKNRNNRNKTMSNFGGGTRGSLPKKENISTGGRGGGGNNNKSRSNNKQPAKTGTVTTTTDKNDNKNRNNNNNKINRNNTAANFGGGTRSSPPKKENAPTGGHGGGGNNNINSSNKNNNRLPAKTGTTTNYENGNKNRNNSNNKNNKNKTAIVWVTRYLDDCGALRVEHLAKSMGIVDDNSLYDIWVMHSHHLLYTSSASTTTATTTTASTNYTTTTKQQRRNEQLRSQSNNISNSKSIILPEAEILLADSMLHLQNLHREYGIQSRNVHTRTIPSFDGRRSGSAKSSFLRLVVDEGYGYAWHIEDDVFYTGNWTNVLSAVGNNPDDSNNNTITSSSLLSSRYRNYDFIGRNSKKNKDWWFYKNRGFGTCKHRVSTITTAAKNKNDNIVETTLSHNKSYVNCEAINSNSTEWMISRISYRFAQSLLTELEQHNSFGHHEAIVQSFAYLNNFTIDGEYLETIPGCITSGGWGKFKNSRNHNFAQLFKLISNNSNNPNGTRHPRDGIQKDGLYHPVKCAAERTSSENVLAVLQQQQHGGGIGINTTTPDHKDDDDNAYYLERLQHYLSGNIPAYHSFTNTSAPKTNTLHRRF